LGYDYLRRFQTANQKLVLDKPDNSTRQSFDPVDASLLVDDPKGYQLVARLKQKVSSIDKDRRRIVLTRLGVMKDDFKNKSISKSSIQAQLLSPPVLKKIAERTSASLCLNKQDLGVELCNFDTIIRKMRSKNAENDTDHNLRLFNTSTLPRFIRDKHCYQRDHSRTLKDSESLNNLQDSKNTKYKTNRQQGMVSGHKLKELAKTIEIDPNRLPYMYMCPSI
jgi:hypothetical protein